MARTPEEDFAKAVSAYLETVTVPGKSDNIRNIIAALQQGSFKLTPEDEQESDTHETWQITLGAKRQEHRLP